MFAFLQEESLYRNAYTQSEQALMLFENARSSARQHSNNKSDKNARKTPKKRKDNSNHANVTACLGGLSEDEFERMFWGVKHKLANLYMAHFFATRRNEGGDVKVEDLRTSISEAEKSSSEETELNSQFINGDILLANALDIYDVTPLTLQQDTQATRVASCCLNLAVFKLDNWKPKAPQADELPALLTQCEGLIRRCLSIHCSACTFEEGLSGAIAFAASVVRLAKLLDENALLQLLAVMMNLLSAFTASLFAHVPDICESEFRLLQNHIRDGLFILARLNHSCSELTKLVFYSSGTVQNHLLKCIPEISKGICQLFPNLTNDTPILKKSQPKTTEKKKMNKKNKNKH